MAFAEQFKAVDDWIAQDIIARLSGTHPSEPVMGSYRNNQSTIGSLCKASMGVSYSQFLSPLAALVRQGCVAYLGHHVSVRNSNLATMVDGSSSYPR